MRLALFLILWPLVASALPSVTSMESNVLLDSYGIISSSPRDAADKSVILLGGLLQKSDADTYRRLINTGADPASIEGPEKIYFAVSTESSTLDAAQLKHVFSLNGYHVSDPSCILPLGSNRAFLYYTRGENRAAEACRKKGESLRSCEEYLKSREIGLATSDDKGLTWTQREVLVSAKDKAKDGGDGTGGAMPSAVLLGNESWLYYTTAKQSFTQENIYRLRLSPDGMKRLAPPEQVKIAGFETGLSLENVQVSRLRCEEGTKFVETMVANNRARTALPMYITDDGLNFKLASPSLVTTNDRAIASPTQMPGPASVEECHAITLSGVETQRELLYSEEIFPDHWQLKRARLKIVLP